MYDIIYSQCINRGQKMIYYFADRLKYLRSRDQISQSSLAKAIETTRATVNAWEMGLSYPNAQSLIAIAKHFAVSVDYLLGLQSKETLDISKLSEAEKNIIINLIHHFENN